MSPLVLSRLAGTVTVDIGENTVVEVGLGIKFSRRGLRVAGYSRRVPHPRREGATVWEYSSRAVGLFKGLKVRQRLHTCADTPSLPFYTSVLRCRGARCDAPWLAVPRLLD